MQRERENLSSLFSYCLTLSMHLFLYSPLTGAWLWSWSPEVTSSPLPFYSSMPHSSDFLFSAPSLMALMARCTHWNGLLSPCQGYQQPHSQIPSHFPVYGTGPIRKAMKSYIPFWYCFFPSQLSSQDTVWASIKIHKPAANPLSFNPNKQTFKTIY